MGVVGAEEAAEDAVDITAESARLSRRRYQSAFAPLHPSTPALSWRLGRTVAGDGVRRVVGGGGGGWVR